MARNEKSPVLIFLAVLTSVYAAEIFLILTFAVSKLIGTDTGSLLLSKPAIIIHLLASSGLICFVYGYFIEPYWLKVSTVSVHTEKLQNTSLRIVQISDLHCDKKVVNEKKAVPLINALEPDIVVFTGDALNTREALRRFKETMKSLTARLGKYAVRGNIDVLRWQGLDLFGGTGFTVLDREIAELQKDGETFYISGFDCSYPAEHHYLPKDAPAEALNVFLHHCPDLIEDLKDSNVDLYLAGHTHGGQVTLPIYGALITFSKCGKKYEAGRYTVGNTVLYVNRGIGLEGGFARKVRFRARPEITVFDISPKKK